MKSSLYVSFVHLSQTHGFSLDGSIIVSWSILFLGSLHDSPAARLNEGAQVISLSSHIPGADPRTPGPQGPRWDANFISENLRKISGIRDSVQLAPVIPVIPVTIWLISSPLDFYGFLRRKIQGPDGFSILPDSANILGFSRTGPPRSP